MSLRPLSTGSAKVTGQSKVLLYADAGWGKTTTAKYYKRRYGNGLVLSAESGLRSLADEDIPYIPISSWDGAHDPMGEVYSFKKTVMALTREYLEEEGIEWLMVDSLTEIADMCVAHLDRAYEGEKNKLAMWGEYGSAMLGACKWIRDLPCHVIVTALSKSSTDENNEVSYRPMLKGQAVAQQLPGIFDFVFAGVRVSSTEDPHKPKVERFVVTDEARGYIAKARDPRRRLKAIERTADITDLLARVDMTESDYDKHITAMKVAAEAEAKARAAS